MKKHKLTFLFIILAMFFIPVIIAKCVSSPGMYWLSTANDWIGFWGSYAGAIIGGLITLLVLSVTIADNKRAEEQKRRQELCAKVANLISNFCVEMMAYRSKWNALYKKAGGKEIDTLEKIELGATTEEPRRIFFELEILLQHIPEAKELLAAVEAVLEDKVTKKSVSVTAKLMDNVRKEAQNFVAEYTNV